MERFNKQVFSKSIYDRKAISGNVMKFKYRSGISPLRTFVKITRDMGMSKAKGLRNWLTEIVDGEGRPRPITGLFNTSGPRWTYGDIDGKKHLVIFELTEGGNTLNVFYFKDFYPKNPKKFTEQFFRAEAIKEGGR